MNELHPAFRQYPELYAWYEFGTEHPEIERIQTAEQLADVWRDSYSSELMRVVPGTIGIMRQIMGNDHPHTLVSVDVDDVLRDTAKAYYSAGSFTIQSHGGKEYATCYGYPYGLTGFDEGISSSVRGLLLTETVPAVEGIGHIKKHLQAMRSAGAFIVASTASAQGTERVTVNFMHRFLPDSFDGIVFNRNPDERSPLTKGVVKSLVRSELQLLSGDTTINRTIMIDDAAHHIYAARSSAEEMGIFDHLDATPRYPWNEYHYDLTLTDTPRLAFELMHERFESKRSTL